MRLDPDPRLPSDGGIGRLVQRLYELLRQMARVANTHADGYVMATQAVATNYTVQQGDSVLLVDATGGARAITLQPAAAAMDKLVLVRKTDGGANAVTLTPAAGLIDGAASLVLTAASPRARLVSDGTNYFTV